MTSDQTSPEQTPESAAQPHKTAVIVVANIKGGAGKTSAAVPLAYAAAQEGSAVVLDLDPSPSAARWINGASLASVRLGVYTIGVKQLAGAIKEARSAGVDLVVVDTPPVLRDVAMQAMSEADLVLIPCHVGTGDIDNLDDTVDLLGLPMRVNPNLKVLAVINHASTMPAVTRRTRAFLEGYGLTVAETDIPFLTTYAEAKGSVPTGPHFPALLREIQELIK